MGDPIRGRNLPDLRRQAVALAASQTSMTQICRELGIAQSTARRWVRQHQEHGDSVHDRSAGRPPRLSTQDRHSVVEKLVQGPEACGYETPLWTLARITDMIYKTTGVLFATNYAAELMHGLGWSCRKPERRAKERDEEAIAGWVQNRWPEIKKGRAT